MIKAFLLVVYPAGTWDSIVLSKRSWPVILLGYLMPLWLIAFVAEGYGLIHWGKPRGILSQLKAFSPAEALVFEILQLLLMLAVVVVGALLIKAMGETFHGRNTFTQSFTATAYGLGPFFAMRILDMFPSISSWAYWVTWAIGILLCLATLYHGIPRVMLPDPPHAFGMFLTSALLLAMVSGLVRFLTYSYLEGKFGKLDAFVGKLVEHLPFLQSLNHMHF